MNKALLIIILTLIIVAPVAYFLGIKAYMTLLAILAGGGLFVLTMMYAYWYIFIKREY